MCNNKRVKRVESTSLCHDCEAWVGRRWARRFVKRTAAEIWTKSNKVENLDASKRSTLEPEKTVAHIKTLGNVISIVLQYCPALNKILSLVTIVTYVESSKLLEYLTQVGLQDVFREWVMWRLMKRCFLHSGWFTSTYLNFNLIIINSRSTARLILRWLATGKLSSSSRIWSFPRRALEWMIH